MEANVKLAVSTTFSQSEVTKNFLIGSTWRGFFGDIQSREDEK